MITILAFIIVLGVLIFFHELGHFIVAKLSGVGVLKFSLGFGPAIIKKRIGETEYQIAAFPLGGYVKMLGEDPQNKDELSHIDPQKSFSHKKLSAKALIVFAGPFFNFLLAVIIYSVVAWAGIAYFLPIIGDVQKGSPADRAGLLPGDRIQTIDRKQITAWDDVSVTLQNATAGKKVEIEVIRDSRLFVVHVIPSLTPGKNLFGEQINRPIIGINLFNTVVGSVDRGSPAEKAGIRPGDRIVAVSQKPVENWDDILQRIEKTGAGKSTGIDVIRAGTPVSLKIAPELLESTSVFGKKSSQLLVGLNPKEPEQGEKEYGLIDGVGYGFGQCFWIIKLTGQAFVKMIKGSISAKDSLGGPILIAQISGKSFKAGLLPFISLIAFISINLAIINLFPIPILDGGYLLLFLIEGITGKAVEGRPREIAQQIGLFILIMLMLFAFYNDIIRLVKGG